MKANKYLIDGEPVCANDLIRMASEIDDDYKNNFLQQTSVAAKILRQNGHTIDYNLDYKGE